MTVTRSKLERERDQEIRQKEAETELEIRKIQNGVKRAAVFLPPVLPLMFGLYLFAQRRSRELEGAAPGRVRQN